MFVIIDSDCDSIPDGAKPSVSEGGALLNLLFCLGYDAAFPPLADVLRKKHNLDGDWIILSPIHWQASHNDALIVAAGKDLDLNEVEAKSWFDLFAGYFAEEGMRLYYHNATTWLLSAPKDHPLKAKPVYHLVNKSFMPELSQLDSTLFWQKFITESQMLCASKSTQSLINGLWPWGNGVLADRKKILICADEYYLPMAKICSSEVCLYNPSLDIKQQQIVLLSDFSLLSEAHQKELNKLSVSWYWNNSAYTCSKSTWLTRLWRILTHAH